jgi:hypothetical protein
MTDRMIFRALAATTLVLSLGACENIREQMGLSKSSPDEFQVVSRAPLTLPPNFALRPPEPGAPRPQEGTTTDQARRTVFRVEEDEVQTATLTPQGDRTLGEQALLNSAGAGEVDPNIRQTINYETRRINEENESFVDDLIFWQDQPPAGEVIEPNEESRRIREADALGTTVTGEGTPVIERKEKGWLEDIF